MRKATQVAQLGQEHGGGYDLDAAQGHERFHGRFHPPSGHVQFNLPVQPRDALAGLTHREQVFLQDHSFAPDGSAPTRAGTASAPRSNCFYPYNGDPGATGALPSCWRLRRWSRTASVRARHRSRIASSRASGTCTAVSSPAR